MARRANRFTLDYLFWLQLTLGIFLITLGIAEIMAYDSGIARLGRSIAGAFGGSSGALNLVAAVVELAAGVVVVAALFAPVGRQVFTVSMWVIVILWGLRILYWFVFTDLLEPDFVVWLNGLSRDAVIGLSLLVITRRGA